MDENIYGSPLTDEERVREARVQREKEREGEGSGPRYTLDNNTIYIYSVQLFYIEENRPLVLSLSVLKQILLFFLCQLFAIIKKGEYCCIDCFNDDK